MSEPLLMQLDCWQLSLLSCQSKCAVKMEQKGGCRKPCSAISAENSSGPAQRHFRVKGRPQRVGHLGALRGRRLSRLRRLRRDRCRLHHGGAPGCLQQGQRCSHAAIRCHLAALILPRHQVRFCLKSNSSWSVKLPRLRSLKRGATKLT